VHIKLNSVRLLLLVVFILCSNVYANIKGIKIETIDAQKYGTVHIPLISKRIDINRDIFHIGQLVSSKSTKALIKNEKYYIVSMEDASSRGKLHAVIKGEYLQRYPYNITILSEIAYQLSRNLMGENYDEKALSKNLERIATNVIRRKGFVLDNHTKIAYSDILLYERNTKVLYKSSDALRMLEEKVKQNRLSYKDAYDFVYGKSYPKKVLTSKSKKLKPLYRLVALFHISKNTKINTEILKLKPLREGSSPVEKFVLSKQDLPFRITKEGSVILAGLLRKKVYDFEAVAHTKDDESNVISFTVIVDEVHEDGFYKL